MNPPKTQTIQYGKHKLTLETGRMARQADGAVLVSMDNVAVLCTAVAVRHERPGQSFFPLTVNYMEKSYAAGKIPGGFFKREGRPSEKETLTSRLIDRPIRPLFPAGFRNEVQVICTVLSADPDIDPDIPALIGASAALALTGAPFAGPVGAARVGYNQEQGYILNPGYGELSGSELNMVVAGTSKAVLMVESEANELPEDTMLGAVLYAHQEMQKVIEAIDALVREAGRERWEWQSPAVDENLEQGVARRADAIAEAYKITDKQQRVQTLATLRADAVAELAEPETPEAEQVATLFGKLEKSIVRGQILQGSPRIDGRDHKTVRPINVEVGVLPNTHGSALFTRGETQALVVATLGSQRDSQIIDALEGERRDPFMLHYNFPPYSVGEAGRVGFTSRRETGHGRLARRGIAATLPDPESFPYAVRVVSEITESNGSSSMASVCGSSLALMDAGVPVSAPVAGIAMGLIKDGDQYQVLTDILGDEDHLGDMDFKVAGSAQGVTALQMDIKIDGITEAIMERALEQAREARIHILTEMSQVLPAPRAEVSSRAPRYHTIKIDPEKIRDLIGKGGATIRALTDETGATIDIEDDGTVRVYAASDAVLQGTIERIEAIIAEPEVGMVYKGKVVRITDFGAFVNILPGRDGLLHISQIANKRVEKVTDYLHEGQEVSVLCTDLDQRGRVKLSMKDVPENTSD